MNDTIIELRDIIKRYQKAVVLDHLDMDIKQGDFIAITGLSGSGKSTLLNIIGLLESPDQGEMHHFGQKNIKPFSRKAQKVLKYHIGYLFQNYALIENKTVEYNCDLVFNFVQRKKERFEKIQRALNIVGLSGFENKKVCQCSGGEQQRIALARLLIKPCDVILADEPTGNLDSKNKELVFELLSELNNKGKTIIMVTHDNQLAERCKMHYRLEDGKLIMCES